VPLTIENEVGEKLRSVQWDFADAFTREGQHGLHPYPAKFIPQIPGALIDLFHPGGGMPVLDPFCGSGTTLVEAANRGLDSVGIDLHPLATLIAKVKLTSLAGDLVSMGSAVTGAAKKRVREGNVIVPPIPRLDHWFTGPVQQVLAALVAEIADLSDPDLADALRVALSSIIVRVSNQESDTRYAAIDKRLTIDEVWWAFERAVVAAESMLSTNRAALFNHRPSVRVVTKDILTVEPSDIGSPVGLVVTSPPYPNAYEYWLYHKYRMYWLGLDPLAVRKSEIGARLHYFKKNHQTEHDFERQMAQCFWLLSQVMVPGSFACFVVGRSIIHGRHIDNEALLTRAAERSDFHKVGSVGRAIAVGRKSFNPAHGTINREQVLVFRLEPRGR
jgi:hypothetical protein